MNAKLHFEKSFSFEKTRHCFRRPALPKKLILSSLFSIALFSFSVAQTTQHLLSIYDSCQVHAPRLQSLFNLKSSGASPRVRVAYVIPSNRTAQPDGVRNLRSAIQLGQEFFRKQM